MPGYLLETSKYFIGCMMLLYLVFTFLSLPDRDTESIRYKISHFFCLFFLFGIHILSFMTLYLEKENITYLFIGLIEAIIIFATLVLFQYIYPEADHMLTTHMCLLLSIGFIILMRLSTEKAIRQLVICVICLVIVLFLPYLFDKLKVLKLVKWSYAILGLLPLFLVLVLGTVTNGSKISYRILGFSFQPSEFVKILFLFFTAAFLWKVKKKKDILVAIIIAALHVIILVLSKDLGTALIYFVSFLFMLYLATNRILLFGSGLLAGSMASVIAYQLFDHVRLRVLVWQNPWNDVTGSGYQITQSLFAIGTGSWFGLGLFRGTPESIPYVETDFIFSAIAEEMGVVFALCILFLFLACFLRIFSIAIHSGDAFDRLLVSGIGIMILFQVFLTVGGGTKLIPLTGVTLPLISYGGSSMVVTLVLFGIVQGTCLNGEQREPRKWSFSFPVWITSCAFIVSILTLIVYILTFSYQDREQLVNNNYNPRQEMIEQQTTRGRILASGGEVLAETIVDENGNEERNYPYENLFSHVIGYDTYGKMGIEKQYNYKLITSGIPLSQKVENAVNGKKNPGNIIQTGLNLALQETASQALGVYKGAIIVTQPSTGKILAMVSKPDFNPNEISQIWDSILEDKESTVFLNRAIQGKYPPGSTFKIITALEYLIEQNDSYQNYHYQCTSRFEAQDSSVQCFHKTAHGSLTLEESFAKSCNSSFANIGIGLNKASFQKTLTTLLFGETIPFELETAISSTALLETTSADNMVQLAIGQGETVITPMHLSMITSAIANNGILMKPYLVESIQTSEGEVLQSISPQKIGRIIESKEATILKTFMEAVVEEGTATKLAGLSYTAAGKTGSAEYNTIKEDSHAWFTGFAPVESPEIAVTIIIEGAGSGGDYAVPIAKRIFDQYFQD